MFWTYLRQKVKEAVLGGVSDALAELDGGEPNEDTSGIAAALKARMLPSPAAELPQRNGKREKASAAS